MTDGKERSPAALSQVVGFRLHQFREAVNLTQQDIATAGKRLGLDWGRSSVAMLERGQRNLSAEELLSLPFVLDEAIRVANPGAEIAFEVTLAELLVPGRKEVLALTEALTLTGEKVESWLGSSHPPVEPLRLQAVAGEAEQKAARKLGVSVEAVMAASERRWGRTLTEERERRVQDQAATDAPRSLQALRGHITRHLLDELKKNLSKRG